MTIEQATTEPVDTDPANPEGVPGDNNREENLRALASSRDEHRQEADQWRKLAEGYQSVLTAAGVEVGEDGEFDQDQLAEWEQRVQAVDPAAKARRALVKEAGFDPDSRKGELLASELANGLDIDDPIELRTFAAQEYEWKPDERYSLSEAEQLLGGRRLDALRGASQSTAGDPESAVRRAIAEARERGDFVTASRLQEEFERSQRRGR